MGNLGYNESLDGHIKKIDDLSSEFLKHLTDINNTIDSSINVEGGAVYGTMARKLNNLWDEKCGSFTEYYKLYQAYVSTLTDITNVNKEATSESEGIYNEFLSAAEIGASVAVNAVQTLQSSDNVGEMTDLGESTEVNSVEGAEE